MKNIVLSSVPSTVVARRVDDHFFVLSADGLRIFEVSDPLNPELVGRLQAPGRPPLPPQAPDPEAEVGESLATNGRILLMGSGGFSYGLLQSFLYVVDVRDASNPVISGSVRLRAADYGPACVLDCTWAYLAFDGSIIDLRDPENPRLMRPRWSQQLKFSNPPNQLPGAQAIANSLEEVSHGRVLTGTIPMYLLDVRRDPLHPRIMARSDASPQSYGNVAWPMNEGGFILSRSETFMPPHCSLRELALQGSSLESAFKTWDASHWRNTGLITGVDEYFVENGSYLDGNPAFSGALPNAWGCGAGSFDAHPKFAHTGWVVQGWHSHGTKFLKVGKRGQIAEIGWFLPYEAHDTFGAHWISDDVVYTIDYPRGIDILRFKGPS